MITEAPSQTFHGQIGQTGKFQCWECNVWKAGYGVLCINPRVREQCFVCMTVNTTIFMGYYKDTPRRKQLRNDYDSQCCNRHDEAFYTFVFDAKLV